MGHRRPCSLPCRATSCAKCCCKTTSRTGSPARGGTFQTPWAPVSPASPLLCLREAHSLWALPSLPSTCSPLKRVCPFQAWTKTGQRSQPPSAGWTRRGPPSWCVTSSPAPRTRRSSRRALAWPSACWTVATPRSRCGGGPGCGGLTSLGDALCSGGGQCASPQAMGVGLQGWVLASSASPATHGRLCLPYLPPCHVALFYPTPPPCSSRAWTCRPPSRPLLVHHSCLSASAQVSFPPLPHPQPLVSK